MAETQLTTTTKNKVIIEACGNDEKVIAFCMYWLKMRNAKEAYIAMKKEGHPNIVIDDNVACVMGSHYLSKINRSILLSIHNLTMERYLSKIDSALEAKKYVEELGVTDDVQAQKPYHDKLGRLLGVEQESGGNGAMKVQLNQQINNNVIQDDKTKYGV